MSNDKMRDEFDSWIEQQGMSTMKDGETYYHRVTHIAWQAWKASRAAPAVQAEPVAWIIRHPRFCGKFTDDKETAEYWESKEQGCTVPLYLHPQLAPAVQGEAVDWEDGYRAAMNEAGWAVRELYINHVHHTGVDGLLKRCQELEQSFICSAEAAPKPAEQQPTCPTCRGGGWDIDCQNRFRPVTCPDCAGSGKFEHSITAQESDSVAPDVTALVEALELIAESCDVGRHDGLPEEGPALCATESWLIAKDALAAYRQQGGE